jgi:hypothetical protein
MPIGLEFSKATAEQFIADLAEGRPIGVIDVESWDLFILAGVLFDAALAKATEFNATAEDKTSIPPEIARYLLSREVGAAIEYAAVLAGLVRKGGYDRACGPVVRVSVDGDREVTPIEGFPGDPPEIFSPIQTLLTLVGDDDED